MLKFIVNRHIHSVSEETRGRRDGIRMTLQNLFDEGELSLHTVQFGLLHCDWKIWSCRWKKYELADDIAKLFRSTELSRQDVSEESSGGRVRARARRNLFGDQSRAEQNRAEHRWTGLVGRSRVETGSRPNLAAVVVQHVFVAKCFRSY